MPDDPCAAGKADHGFIDDVKVAGRTITVISSLSLGACPEGLYRRRVGLAFKNGTTRCDREPTAVFYRRGEPVTIRFEVRGALDRVLSVHYDPVGETAVLMRRPVVKMPKVPPPPRLSQLLAMDLPGMKGKAKGKGKKGKGKKGKGEGKKGKNGKKGKGKKR